MTTPEIPEEAVDALIDAIIATPREFHTERVNKANRDRFRAGLTAALPHLRAQETPSRYRLAWLSARRRAGHNLRAALFLARHNQSQQLVHDAIAAPLAEQARASHPRPVVDREALIQAFGAVYLENILYDHEIDTLANAILAVLPTEEDTKA